VESMFKKIFGGTIGRLIIDFLGVKAGAAVGEFMGTLIGKIAGKITGKGILGKAIGERLLPEIMGLVGKGAGAIMGGLAADDLALGAQRFLNAPSANFTPPQNQSVAPSMSLEVNVDANSSQPQAIADAVVLSSEGLLGRSTRQLIQGVQTMTPNPAQ
jgi:hypothetical protein